MDEDKSLKKILKWAGVVALIAVPVIVFLKKKKTRSSGEDWDDESDIYATELEE